MHFLKDIPDLDTHPDIQYLKDSSLWKIPLRFINEKVLKEFHEQAEEVLTPERAADLVNHIVASISIAKFLGQIDHTQIKNYSTGV